MRHTTYEWLTVPESVSKCVESTIYDYIYGTVESTTPRQNQFNGDLGKVADSSPTLVVLQEAVDLANQALNNYKATIKG